MPAWFPSPPKVGRYDLECRPVGFKEGAQGFGFAAGQFFDITGQDIEAAFAGAKRAHGLA